MDASPDRVVAGLLGERYEITGLIASGGMGSVYRARDSVLGRTVALKVLKTGEDPAFAARFRSEATNAARLSHPNVVQVYDFGYADDTPYMAMEYVDGQTVRDVLNARGKLPPPLAARIATQVASALEHARRNGIVHRDVKPENILITTDGMVKVADFGLSRALAESRATQAGVIVGTAHYLAPEQIGGGSSDHRTDIYALGVVLYEMLTGRTPFEGDTPVVIAYKRVSEDVPSVLAADPSIPRELDVIVARATAREPDERFATAGEMLEALRRATPRSDTGEIGDLVHHTQAIPLEGHETVVLERRRAASGTERRAAGRKRRRFRRWVALAAALFVLGSAVWAGSTKLQRIEVPEVVGQQRTVAERTLRAAGFDVEVVLENDPEVPNQHVISQDPDDGTLYRRGSAVTLVVSLGPEVFGVPDVLAEPVADAEAALRARGFDVRRVDVFDPDVPKLHVVAQDPDAGVLLEKGSPVTISVSKGPEMVRVPNVVGDPVESAKADLQAAGFDVVVAYENHDKVPKDEVISQTPKPGTTAEKGTRVKLVVSKGPVMVTVPRIICMSRRQAADVLASKGFTMETSGGGPIVVDQSPAPRAKAPKGSRVTAYLGPGSFC